MNEPFRLSRREHQPKVRYGERHFRVRPAYPALLILVLVVGSASLLAWFHSEFSTGARAARGDMSAQYRLGKEYFDAALTPRDYQIAVRWIRKSAEQGYARAQTGLGLLYENGLGVPKDYALALSWLRRAADQGYCVAQNELGVMYAKGRGVPRNLTQAVYWCKLAAAQGSDIAKRNLQLAEVAAARVIPDLGPAVGKAYHRAVLRKIESDGVTVSFQPVPGGFGLAKVKLENLPSDLRQLCSYATKEEAAAESAYSRIGAIATTL